MDVGPRTNKADRESITGQYRISKFTSLLSNNQNSSYDWSVWPVPMTRISYS